MESLYSNDQPVSKPEQDVFQRYNFSERIAKTVINNSTDDCIVIGLYGAWGDGKTSVLNFIEDELKKEPLLIKYIKFNPWRYKGEEDLLTSFFLNITKSLSESLYNHFEKLMKQVGIFGSIKMPWMPDPSSIGKHLSSVDVETLKDRVSKFLIKSSYRRLVVIIDDIDRLDKQEIYAIMKLVKLTADFTKTTYILSFDDKMVASAIGERFSTGNIEAGYSFLEKIIQVPLRLPQIPLSNLRKYCLHKIYDSLNKNAILISEDEVKDFERVFEKSLISRLTTPRLAIRYANSLSFSLPILLGEVNNVDFMLVEGLKIFYPVHYEYVKNNSDYFINNLFISNITSSNDQIDFMKSLFNLIPDINDTDKNSALYLLKYLFPMIEKYSDNRNHSGITAKNEWYTKKRISSVEYFRRYFTYSLNEDEISDITISNFIKSLNTYNDKEIISQISNIILPSSADNFLMKVSNFPEFIDQKYISKLILSMIKMPEFFTEIQKNTYNENPSLRNRLAVFIFEKLMEIDDKFLRYEIAENIMKEAKTFDLAYHIHHELRRKFKDNEQLYDSVQYNQLGIILRSRAITEAGNIPIFEYIQKINQLQYLFNNWYIVNALELQAYVSKIINEHPDKIKYLIMGFSSEGSSSYYGLSRKFNFEDVNFNFLDNIINTEEIYNLTVKHFDSVLKQKSIEYIDMLNDEQAQTYENAIRQFIDCYERIKIKHDK